MKELRELREKKKQERKKNKKKKKKKEKKTKAKEFVWSWNQISGNKLNQILLAVA